MRVGPGGLSPEHIVYGGELLVLLKKIINHIVSLEEVPICLNEGIVVLIYKRQGKDPLLLNSYHGITLSSISQSVLSKVLKITLLQRLFSLLNTMVFLISCKLLTKRVFPV